MQFIIPTILLSTIALAAPTPIQPTNTATCSLKYAVMKGTWTVNIGRPYLDGTGCAFVKKSLRKGGMSISSAPGFKCEDDGEGMTRLEFTTVLSTKKQNAALEIAYPMIPFVQNGICDPYLV
ncbi:uncharacterized protein RCC_00491 [Ramularia collo-cygni]|uniref:Uncharacterized protein n=1 Tax=Ramularia collo-cygni TaxID=112498 RepID=A0A2D3UWR3_9PEZI|nr:uncharacterized protein RCC_00491 [Ramularia collo-cygni]CZT14514.1 uncharacterized protein RCC_00491 [Ramularia collo-cygni]